MSTSSGARLAGTALAPPSAVSPDPVALRAPHRPPPALAPGPPNATAIARRVGHRPWPLPREPWLVLQSWRDVLFAHWPVPAERLRPLVPRELVLDLFEGVAFVALTPLRITRLRPRFFPELPGLEFPELNLRTYVRCGERRGVYFFSLDAASWLAVLAARLVYALPYYRADMNVAPRAGWFRFTSRRLARPAELDLRFRPEGPAFRAEPGTLDEFLIERYALFTVPRPGKVVRTDIHHLPWELHRAEAQVATETVAAAHELELSGPPPLLHYAPRQDTLIYRPRRVV